MLDRSLNIVGANKAYLAATKRRLEDIVGRWAWDAFPTDPETLKRSIASFERVIQTRQPDTMALLRFDIPRPESEGGGFEVRYWSITHSPVLDEAGEVELVLQHPIDVTELHRLREAVQAPGVSDENALGSAVGGIVDRARSVYEANLRLKDEIEARQAAERELKASEEKYRALFANMTEALAIGEPVLDERGRPIDLRVSEANQAFYRQTGIPQEVEGRRMREYLPQLEQIWVDRLAAVVRTGKPDQFDHFNIDTRRHYKAYAFSPAPGRFANLFTDITEQKRIEIALQESESYLRQLIATLPGMVWTTAPDGAVDFVSQQWLDYTGTTSESQLGDGWLDCIHPEDQAAMYRNWHEAVAHQAPGTLLEYRLRRHDGTYRWFSSRGTPTRDSSGTITRWLGVVTDIDELKRTQQALADSERRLSMALAAGNSAVWEMDVASGVVRGEDSLYSMYGYQPGELKTLADWNALIDEADRPCILEMIEATLKGKQSSFSYEARLLCKDGAYRWNLSEALVTERDAEGRVLRLVGTHSNIEARKRAEEMLRQERSRLQAIIDNSPLLIRVKDMESRVVLANKAIFDNLKVLPREKLIGRSIFEAFPQDVGEARWVQDLAAMERDAPVRAEESLRHRDGTWHTYVTTRFPVRDIETAELIGVCAISTDITDRKEAEAQVRRLNVELEQRVAERTAELAQSNEALLRSNTDLRQFAYATAHDLQTPLRSIAGFTQLLQQEVAGGEKVRVQEYSSQVIDNTRRLQTLIENLLDYTRLEALGLPFKPVDLRALAAEVVLALTVLIQETGAEVQVGPLPTLPADHGQMAQLFQNLIENGIKYNQSKPPKIGIASESLGDEWLFWVSDNGIGIDPKHHERIFEVFRRLHTYGQVAGSGIGLAACRRIVERHGGRIWVESRPGEGSTFYFTLPVK